MRTVSYRLGDLARATINIGKVAENEYTRVQFNADQIFAEYPSATPSMAVISPAGVKYPAVVTREGNLIIWDVTDADLTAEGMGELQLTLTENGVVCKSFIARTRIERSIVADGEAPDPVQNWLDEAAEVLEEVQDAIPAGGTQGQVMGKLSDDDYDIGWIDQTGGGGGGGTSNYNDLSNKPQIAGTTLTGNKTLAQLGIASASDVSAKYTKPGTGIPASDMASAVQTSLGKADTAYQLPSGGVPSSDMASAVQTSLGKADTAYQKPAGGIPASDMAYGVIPVLTDLIDDTAGDGDTDKVWSADKTAEEVSSLSSAIAPFPSSASAGDVGKFLKAKTVSGGKVTEYEFGSGGGGGSSGADEWLEKNDLDAESGGKYNMLNVPYTSDDVEDGKQITQAGSIGTSSSMTVSPLIPVSEGTYGLKTAHNQYIGNINPGNSYKNGYGFFAADGETVVSRPATLLHNISGDIYVFDVPQDAKYVRFCYVSNSSPYYASALAYFNQWILLPDANDNIDDSFFTLSEKKSDGEIKKIFRVDGSYLEIVDEEARSKADEAIAVPITFGRRTCAIFEKVCCIGDSYTAGYIYNTNGAHTNNAYSWVKHLETLTGREYVNCGISGATTASWLTNQDGLAKAQLSENKAQAYIIGLQINDVQTELPVGTVSDIGTSAQTYYGCTSKIIDELFNINGSAHVFVLARPTNTGTMMPYRTAILNIVEWYQTTGNGTHQSQVHLIDLLDYVKMFQYAGCNDSMANGHFTAVGYESVAEIMMYALSNYLNAHPLLFQDVNLIPFGTST